MENQKSCRTRIEVDIFCAIKKPLRKEVVFVCKEKCGDKFLLLEITQATNEML
jgi:hypothetical protein